MSWVKRNLFFLVGGGIAVALLVLAGLYLYGGWTLNEDNYNKLDEAYKDWKRILALPINPGNDKVDNIKAAIEYRDQARQVIGNVRKSFIPVPPIPNTPRVSKDEFASGLRRTVDQLQRDAGNASVILPAKYQFSFEAQKSLPNFAEGSLPQLARQLGEIKNICDVMFRAKINSLDSVRREKVSSDDDKGPPSDYLDPSMMSVTNELAVLAPYEITFKCFGAELAGVLSGFANGPHGVIVKSINVEPAAPAVTLTSDAITTPGAVAPGYYGQYYGQPGAYYVPTAAGGGVATMPAATVGRGGLVTVLDEKPLKVVMVLSVVRLLPGK